MCCLSFKVSVFLYVLFGAWVAQWVRSLDLTTHTSLSPIRRGFTRSFVNYKKGCTRLAAASDKVFQLLAQGRWFSPGTPAPSTTKTGRHDIAEILLKVALNTKNSNSNSFYVLFLVFILCLLPNVASVSGLSILDCPFGFLIRFFKWRDSINFSPIT